MLTINEYRELKDVIILIEVVGCYGTADILREIALKNKATEEQIEDIEREIGIYQE